MLLPFLPKRRKKKKKHYTKHLQLGTVITIPKSSSVSNALKKKLLQFLHKKNHNNERFLTFSKSSVPNALEVFDFF